MPAAGGSYPIKTDLDMEVEVQFFGILCKEVIYQ